jgi:peptidoglycan/xylan/chitin deacetylase (PgdA/CDA1 family)
MHKYFIKTPWWLKKLYPNYVWNMPPDRQSTVYLTFDDGPHPEITPWIMSELKRYNAKATFFCIGKNVEQHPKVYKKILDEGHATGNHTQNHINGWKVSVEEYKRDVSTAALHIRSNLFRPPYGRIKISQAPAIAEAMRKNTAKIIMWDVLAGDFDRSVMPENCLSNVLRYTAAGSIVVFHDSEKAYKNLVYTLPTVMQHFTKKGCLFNKIEI